MQQQSLNKNGTLVSSCQSKVVLKSLLRRVAPVIPLELTEINTVTHRPGTPICCSYGRYHQGPPVAFQEEQHCYENIFRTSGSIPAQTGRARCECWRFGGSTWLYGRNWRFGPAGGSAPRAHSLPCAMGREWGKQTKHNSWAEIKALTEIEQRKPDMAVCTYYECV